MRAQKWAIPLQGVRSLKQISVLAKVSLLMTKALDILAVKSDGAYCHVVIAIRRPLTIKPSISLWEECLPPCTFLRVSRRLILNKRRIDCVKAVNRDEFQVHLQGEPDPILVSRLEMSRMRAFLG